MPIRIFDGRHYYAPGTAPSRPHSFEFKRVMRWDPSQRKLRLFRVLWERGEWGLKRSDGRCIPYSFKLTFAIRPKLFSWRREYDQIRVTVLGIAVSYHWSAGGRMT